MNRKKNKSSGKKKKRCERTPSIGQDESYTDFLCPICLQILIEPVQLPCRHELCMACFKMHVENTSLQCPMCRLRISIWVRNNTKSNTLINEQRWELIKSLFPERVERRMNGGDDLESSYSDYNAPKHVIASKGELRREYEEEVKKIEAERAEVNQANLEYIKQLVDKDAEYQKKQEELDEAAAKALQKEEMEHLGVTLKSPSSHQRALLALYKPKSPMKLRDKKVIVKSIVTMNKANHTLTSPNHQITNFFKPSVNNSYTSPKALHTAQRSSPRLSPYSNAACSSANGQDSDFDYARRLQERFNREMNYKSSYEVQAKSPSELQANSRLSSILSSASPCTVQIKSQSKIATKGTSKLQTIETKSPSKARSKSLSSIQTRSPPNIQTKSPSCIKRKQPLRQKNSPLDENANKRIKKR